MKLTILGCNGSYPKPGGACSGYLIEDNHTKILLDCGSGVMRNLQRYCRVEELDALILSHLHNDHISDVLVLKYYLDIQHLHGRLERPLKLYLPAEPADMFEILTKNSLFEARKINEHSKLSINHLNLSFLLTTHTESSLAIHVESPEKILVYSGDAADNPHFIDFVQGADLFLCESTFLTGNEPSNSNHLTAKKAAQIAQAAKVKKLVLTHFNAFDAPRQFTREATKYCKPVYAAKIGKIFTF